MHDLEAKLVLLMNDFVCHPTCVDCIRSVVENDLIVDKIVCRLDLEPSDRQAMARRYEHRGIAGMDDSFSEAQRFVSKL
jgi:hypothetical protein